MPNLTQAVERMTEAEFAQTVRQLATAKLAPTISGILLALFAVIETFVRASITAPAPPPASAAVPIPILLLLAVFTTLPVTLLEEQPVMTALTVTTATVLSITPFHALTIDRSATSPRSRT